MKTICLYFEIHQIIHLKRYRFFDIGTDHYYYDDYENERNISDIAERSYMPALTALEDMIKANGQYFKVAFSISGVGMEQLELHAPQVLEKLQDLNKTGCVEFLAEPYSHGLASLVNEESFKAEVQRQAAKMEEYFGRSHKCCATLHSSIAMISVCRLHRWVLPACLPRVPSMCWAGSLLTMFTTAPWLQSSSSCCVMCA